ncbi:hypothetical protein WJ84_00955 [Burkholderia ubonensis]|nr:hypothetical protein WJ84_00955 [Burkholderia ubonensis]
MDGGEGDDYLYGGPGNDRLTDTGGSNVFDGGDGDDILGSTLTTAFWGPNTYIGGRGNDIIYGSRGGDTYIFNLGDGQDIIRENQFNAGGDIFKFGAGIQAADWTVSRTGAHLVLTHKNGLDKLTFEKWFDSTDEKAYQVEKFVFVDGTVWSNTQLTERALTVFGTEGPDNLKGLDSVNNIIHGLGGNDIITGGSGADKLYGEEGDDTIYGGGGNDFLYGGPGNDYLEGGAGDDYMSGGDGDDRLYDTEGSNVFDGGDGNDTLGSPLTTAFWGPNTYIGGRGNDVIYGSRGGDTYIFNLGDGQDIIRENQFNAGGDTFKFGADIQAADWAVSRSGAHLVLTHKNGTDKLTFEKWFDSTDGKAYQVERFVFADGTMWSNKDLSARALTVVGPATAATISGSDYNDMLFGGAGNDTLKGGYGHDLLYGDRGNDSLDGGFGVDVAIGGAGDDTYTTTEVILFNKGDGNDKIASPGTSSSVISIGQATLSELSLVRSGAVTKLQIGSADSITLTNQMTQPTVLQVVGKADNGSIAVKTFDLTAMVNFLYGQGAGALTSSGFAGYSLGEYADSAYGGDLAVLYANNGMLDHDAQANLTTAYASLTSGANQLQLLSGLGGSQA